MGTWHPSRSRMTMVAATLSLIAATSFILAPQALAVPTTATCPQVEVTTARGQGEQAGSNGSVLGPMSTALQNQLSQTVKIYPLPYDAGQDVVASSNRGITLLTQHLSSMRTTCPNTKFVVLGFSLGAVVVGETFAPATRYPGITTLALPTRIDAKVAAVVVFGDVRFNNTMPQSAGTFLPNVTGQLPRPATAFARFGDHVRDVCNQADGVCQAVDVSQTNPQAHQDYVKYTDDLVWYVRSQLDTIA
jgi:Cutinase